MNGPLGVLHKLRLQEEGGRLSKKLTFRKLLYHRKRKRRGVGGQKKSNLVNVVCERPLMSKFLLFNKIVDTLYKSVIAEFQSYLIYFLYTFFELVRINYLSLDLLYWLQL